MRQRRQIRPSQMGEPIPRRVEKEQPRPAVEWTKAIVMSITVLSGFVMFALSRKANHLARKASDFRTFDKCDLATYPMWKIDEAEQLNLSQCGHVNLPDDVEVWSKFKSLKKLDLNSNALDDLPMSMTVLAPSLEILFLSENKFSKIPDVIKTFKRLRVLSLRGNSLTELSSEHLPVSSLVWLILTNNKIAEINANIKDLKLMRKLMLSHNDIGEIPVELGECKDLELVRLANNNLEKIPTELLMLPKLAWISLSGNPIFQSKTPTNSEKVIKEEDILINESKILGKGASGTVFAGSYQGQDVAIKIFKEQSKGSDGNAEDEMSINSIIDNEFAISAIGVVEKNGKKTMLVMKLLKGTSPLGLVPSFHTVTRDQGPDPLAKKIMNKQILMKTIWNIASALEYIHSSLAVSHGDVYLHNMLIDGERVSRISDWGASFAYDSDNIEQAELLERVEVLAFGRLIQDMVLWHPSFAKEATFKELLGEVLQPSTQQRPSFKVIKEKLMLIPDMSEVIN